MMIISCAKCTTKYKLNPSTIGEDGRRVRCTKCSYVWTQYNADESHNRKESGVKIDLSRHLPVVIEYVVPAWFKALPIVFLCLILLTSVFFFQEPLSDKFPLVRKLYEKIGMNYTESVVIDKFDITKVEGNQLDINGFLVNKSQDTRKIPNVVVRAIDEHNTKIASFKIKASARDFSGGEKHAFFKRIENLPSNTKLIILEIQDKFDWLRK